MLGIFEGGNEIFQDLNLHKKTKNTEGTPMYIKQATEFGITSPLSEGQMQ
jgi:hypothetical protein